MTGADRPRRTPRGAPAGWRTRLRAAHPTVVLRWLRAGVLASVVVTALLYLVVSVRAGDQIAAARRTDRAIGDITTARADAQAADVALVRAFTSRQVPLIGTSKDFDNRTARVSTDVTSATEGNAAGVRGLQWLGYVQNQLANCRSRADIAVLDYARAGDPSEQTASLIVQAAHHALTDARQRDRETGLPIPGTGGLTASLDDLRTVEADALAGQRDSLWLAPACVWPLLVGPSAVMLLLVLATRRVVNGHFRRYLDPRLPLALLATTAVGVVTAVLVGGDAHRLAAHPLAGHPVTLALSLVALAGAGVLAYLAYRPRLAEYRFPRS
ncbi:hypothetical protein AB0M29_16210 [Streptomyces sp. NPDC051976]|uniref:hypothetical protein n=1 Tax=Streptomyces sp. NPDC051976 TaxID=3154947 RepID=UPI00341CD384